MAINHRSPVERYRAGAEVRWSEFETFEHRSMLARIVWEDAGRPEEFDFTEWSKNMDKVPGVEFVRDKKE